MKIPLNGLLDGVACPACGAVLRESDELLVCKGCRAAFPLSDGIPHLILASGDCEKRAQAAFYDHHPDEAHETMRPWDRPRFHAWLLEEKFRMATEPIGRLLGERPSTLVVCGGAGLDAELLLRFGGEVVTSDSSAGASQRAVERARRRRLQYVSIVADAERLPFRDHSMDLVFVHDGLHHLSDPEVGVREMFRVARRAVAISEPARSLATSMAIQAGIAERVEEAGNEVKRLALGDLRRLANEAGFEILRAARYGMYYRDGTGIVTRISSAPGVFPVARGVMRVGMRLSAPFGNKLVLVATRRDGSRAQDGPERRLDSTDRIDKKRRRALAGRS